MLNEDQKLLIEATVQYAKTNSIAPTPLITSSEVNEAMSEVNKASAIGEDGLSIELIICTTTVTANSLMELYNACLLRCYFPYVWKKARIIILKKPGKCNYTDIKSYRPISVLNALGKIFEKIIHKRLLWCAKNGSWFSDRQHGFLENRSTETASLKLASIIEKNKRQKVCTAVLYLDISAAFDTAWPPAIIDALVKKNLPSISY